MLTQKERTPHKPHRINIDPRRMKFGDPISYKVIGLPGTGKTTFLINSVEEMLKHGIAMDDILYCSHTKAAVHEVIERLTRKFPKSEPISRTVKTIHAMSYQLVKANTVVKDLGRKPKREFLESFLTTSDYEVIEEFEENQEDDPDWNYRRYSFDDLFRLSSTLQLAVPDGDPTQLIDTITDFWLELVDRDIEQELVQLSFNFHMQYLNFKQSNDYFEFEDLLSYVMSHELYPSRRVLIMDEFQDCSPLQFEIYKLWASKMQLSIIAGDPNQAIYGFQNSTPHFLLSHHVSELEIVLNTSYRLPPKIVELAQQQMASSKYMTDYQSDISIDYEGSVDRITLSDLVVHEGSAFILVRTNSQMDWVSTKLTEQGILHTTDKKTIPKDLLTKLEEWYPILFQIYHKRFSGEDIINLMSLCQPAPPNTVGKRNHVFRQEDIAHIKSQLQAHTLNLEKLLQIIDLEKHEFFKLIIRYIDKRLEPIILMGLEKQFLPTQVIGSITNTRLMTIHKSKGKEADTVILVDKATYYERQGREDSEEERRVWYVGITRAKKRLVILSLGDSHTKYIDGDDEEDDDE